MAIRFERDGAVGSIVLANPPLTHSICALRRLCGSQCIRPAKATYACWAFARRATFQLRRRSPRMAGKGRQLVQCRPSALVGQTGLIV